MIQKGQLKVWHNSNLGEDPFIKHVQTIQEAKDILALLAEYDLYLGDKIQANAQGLEVYVGEDVDYDTDKGWEEWQDKEGKTIDEV